jgi:hypothetical protein
LAAPLSFMFCGIYVAWETVLLDELEGAGYGFI